MLTPLHNSERDVLMGPWAGRWGGVLNSAYLLMHVARGADGWRLDKTYARRGMQASKHASEVVAPHQHRNRQLAYLCATKNAAR